MEAQHCLSLSWSLYGNDACGSVAVKPGFGRIFQQTFINATLCDRKTPITAAEILNDQVEEHGIVLCRVLTDGGTEYCGKAEDSGAQCGSRYRMGDT